MLLKLSKICTRWYKILIVIWIIYLNGYLYNNLSINTNKTKYTVFGRKYKLNNLNVRNLNITINNDNISYEQQIKYLGVVFDPNLNFYNHADYIMRKFSKKVSFISRVGGNLTFYTRLLLYKSIAAPHLEFCATLLYNLPNFKIQQFQVLQNRAMRAILKCNRYTPIVTILNVLQVLSVKQKIMFNVYVFLFKAKTGLLPKYICDNLKVFSDVHNYNTRNINDFILSESCNTSQMLNSVLYKGLYEFNKLPCDIKNCDNLKLFKVHIRRYILS